MDDPLILPTVSATRNRLADLMTSIGQGAGKAVDWLAGGAQVGAEPTLALMRGDALGEPFLPTAESGGRLGAIASAVTAPLVPGSAPAGALGVYGGRLAKTADHAALARAEQMHAAGHADEAIRAETGWFRGPEGKWRFEIPDNRSTVDLAGKAALGSDAPDMDPRALSGLLQHPDLFAAYPDLAGAMTTTRLRAGRPEGSWNGGTGIDRIDASGAHPDDVRSALLHESQHAIQEREGFARGGNEGAVNGMQTSAEERLKSLRDTAMDRYWEVKSRGDNFETDPVALMLKDEIDAVQAELAHIGGGGFQGYQRLAGEVEARDVQARMNMPNSQRAATAPYSSQGIPPEQMILRGGGASEADMAAASVAALDLSPEARAARAAEMGFDPNRTLYHGTNAETPIDAFQPSEWGHFGPGVYLSEQPGVAGAYGNAIYPVHSRGEMFNARPGFETRLKGAEAQEMIDAMPARPAAEAWKDNRIAAQKRLDEQGYIDRETMWNYLAGQVGRDKAQEILKARGYAGIEGIGDGAETVIFDPSNIRSRFAAFDPARSGESDLLASRAGVPAVPPQPQPQPQPEDPATAAARAAWIQQHLARGGM